MLKSEQLHRMTDLFLGLGEDEREVLIQVAERLKLGQERYGQLTVADDSRDYQLEAREEALDGVVYLACDLLRHKRTSK